MLLEVGKTYFIRTESDILYTDATILAADEKFIKVKHVYEELLRIEIIPFDRIKDAKEMSVKDKVKVWYWRESSPKMITAWLSQEEYKLNKDIRTLYTDETEAKEKVFEAALEDPSKSYGFETKDGDWRELRMDSYKEWFGGLATEFKEWKAQREAKED